ncbi:hypothetical protein GINT2_000566 [Glugoides intestinalis]
MQDVRYIVKKIIGEGVSSTVYKAFDIERQMNVAIKVFNSRRIGIGNREGELTQEHRILERLKRSKSEHIIKFYGCLTDPTFVFELCDCNLISFLNEHELDHIGIKKIMRMVLLGIRAIHEKGIIHRDIKLGNIVIKDDNVKICDFGLSCFVEENSFSYCGTRDYLAPEMERIAISAKGGVYDQKIDVYAAGVIYKTLLCRRKDVELESIQAERSVKDLIEAMTSVETKRRITAEAALKHRCFDELFIKVPDFRELRTQLKSTRYGVISKKPNYIQIEYKIEEEVHLLRIEGKKVESHQEPFSYRVSLDGEEIEERMMDNSILKRFNYLCSYFKIVCEKTIKYQKTRGDYTFTVTVNNTQCLESKWLKLKRNGESCEIVGETERGVEMKYEEIPRMVKAVFEEFEQEYRRAGSFQVEQQASLNVSVNTEPLIKKYEFVGGVGWVLKRGLCLTLLLNDGRKYFVNVEERRAMLSDGIEVKLEKLTREELQIFKKCVEKFV